MLDSYNRYVRDFKIVLQMMLAVQSIVIHADKMPTGQHERRYNASIVNEMAIVIVINVTLMPDNIHFCFGQGEDGYHIQIGQLVLNKFQFQISNLQISHKVDSLTL